MKAMIRKLLKEGILTVYRMMCLLFPVHKHMVVFMSNLGRSYGGNPKSIYEEMVRQGLDKKYSCYFLLEDPKTQLPGNAKAVKMSRLYFYYVLSCAGYLICDTRLPNYIKKRKKVTYLQTWHGTPLKKLALDMKSIHMAGGESIVEYQKEFRKNSLTWDYLISQNSFSSEIFRRAFDFHKTILECGYPRNDILFYGNSTQFIEQLKKTYHIPLDKKIILYAPTWRDNSYYDKASYRMDAPIDYDLLYEELKEDYIILIKYHYMVREHLDFSAYHGFYRVMDSAYDISELYLISDMMITDYSSVMFDYTLLNRPILFYVYDLKEYEEELRGFYFDFLREAPGPCFMDTLSMIQHIQTYDASKYIEKYCDFKKKYHTFEYGNASQKVIECLFGEKNSSAMTLTRKDN